jgi:hypothetical protein
VRDLVIVIADLYLPHAADIDATPTGARFPGLERIARFGERSPLAHGWRAWLAGRCARADLIGVAPACIAAAASDAAPAGATRWLATPLHLSAGPAGVHLDRRGILRLRAAELAELAAGFAASFAGAGLVLRPLPSGEFLLDATGIPAVESTEPALCLGGDLAQALPRGAAAVPLRRALAEIEMWLHGAALNEARARRGEPPVTTLWLWGGGWCEVRPERRAAAHTWPAYGADAYLQGLWHLQGSVCRDLPERLEGAPGAQAGGAVWVLEVGRQLQIDGNSTFEEALARLDAAFVSPALEALRRGALASVTVVANDRLTTLGRRSGLRLWRRPRAGLRSLT